MKGAFATVLDVGGHLLPHLSREEQRLLADRTPDHMICPVRHVLLDNLSRVCEGDGIAAWGWRSANRDPSSGDEVN